MTWPSIWSGSCRRCSRWPAHCGESDPLASQTALDALARAQELTVTSRMRSAADHLEQNQPGRSLTLQQEAAQNLQELADILANRREHELARLVKKLREAQTDLDSAISQQTALQEKMERQSALPTPSKPDLDRLAEQQKELQEETQRLARRLERLMATEVGKIAGQGASSMGQASAAASQGKPADAARHAGQSKANLEEAARRLDQQRRRIEADLAGERLARLQDAIRSLAKRQDRAAEETRRLDGLRRSQRELTSAQQSSLTDLAREQRFLQRETAELARKLRGAEVLAFSVKVAASEMAKAAGWLDRGELGSPVQESQQAALVRLRQLLESFQPDEPEKKEPEKENSSGSSADGDKGKSCSGDAAEAKAQIKLLRLLQQDVNRRTREFEEKLGRGVPLADEDRRRFTELSREQGRLADLLLAIIPPDDSPDVQVAPSEEIGPSPSKRSGEQGKPRNQEDKR